MIISLNGGQTEAVIWGSLQQSVGSYHNLVKQIKKTWERGKEALHSVLALCLSLAEFLLWCYLVIGILSQD